MNKCLAALILLAFALPACHRSSREVWEDTKSAKRHMGKGLRSLMGRHIDSSDYALRDGWGEENSYTLPLSDDDIYTGNAAGSSSSSSSLADLGAGIPLSKESPGDPGSPIPGIDGFKMPDGELARLFRNIQFDTDNYTVKGKENLETLQTIADYLARHKGMYVFIEGHADERGAASYNLALGSRRANSIRSILVQNGVSPDQLFTISYGKEKPIVQGHDENAWGQNRRGQFKVYER